MSEQITRKIKIYELAKQLNLSGDTIIDILRKRGFDVKYQGESVSDEIMNTIMSHFKRKKNMSEQHKYQVFPYEQIPHRPLQISSGDTRITGISGWSKFWLGFVLFYATYTVFYYASAPILDLHSPAVLLPLAISVVLAVYLVIYVDKRVRRSKYRELVTQEAQKRREEAESISTNLNAILASSSELAVKASEYLKNASGWLQTARREYAENAYDPFWTAIENAAVNIDAFNRTVNTLSSNIRKYYAQLEGRNHTFPAFPVRLESLPDPKPIMEEFRHVVRKGQTNFQFANIWEHRKTREVLIAGFRTLGEAIDNLTSVVEREISSLSATLHSDLVQLVEEQIRTREAAEKSAEEQAETRESIEQLKRRGK
jgi:hypothetical protein